MLLIKLGHANTQIIGGYGVTSMETLDFGTDDMVAENIFVGLENRYLINKIDTLVFTGLLSSNRKNSIAYLNELELQIIFEKKMASRHYFGMGFNITHLLDEKFENFDFSGNGFGLNMSYKYKFSPKVAFNCQLYSNSYDIKSDSSTKFNVHTFRTFVSVYP